MSKRLLAVTLATGTLGHPIAQKVSELIEDAKLR
jgi:hypothetical protein